MSGHDPQDRQLEDQRSARAAVRLDPHHVDAEQTLVGFEPFQESIDVGLRSLLRQIPRLVLDLKFLDSIISETREVTWWKQS